jgi:hypothetical protein
VAFLKMKASLETSRVLPPAKINARGNRAKGR